MNVLIVEDDPVISLGLEQKLTELGYGLAGRAGTGSQAVERARELKPDIILMDVMIPEFDGLEAARRISAAGLRVPVVAITAHEDPDLVERAISVGVAAYLMKPVSRAQLRSALELARSRQNEFETLRSENADLRQALATRKLVERAKGVLMDQGGLTEADAFSAIQQQARRTGRTMAEVAGEIVRSSEVLAQARRSRRGPP
ncbi:MAG TPA: response regulator [Acidimicrobiia bacterium]|nr:response regulator [Acidimicrobiia bacterium]